MAMDLELEPLDGKEAGEAEEEYMKGVRRLCEKGITKLPGRYILPPPDRPKPASEVDRQLKLPVIDLGQLLTPARPQVLEALDKACKDYGFFQVVNHGVSFEDIRRMINVGKRFFELPFEERARYMSKDIREPVRYGTSFNQINDTVFCWRDFLKLNCQPLDAVLPCWPSSPADLSGARRTTSHEPLHGW